MNKKWIVLPLMLLFLTSCNTQPSSQTSSTPIPGDTPERPSSSDTSTPSSLSSEPDKPLDPIIKQICKDLNSPDFQLEIELSGGTSIDKPGNYEVSQEIAKLLESNQYDDIENLDIESLEGEMVDNRIQLQVVGSDHWTQILCYTLSSDYGDKAGKTYVEIIPSTQEYMGLKGYNMADASTFLYSENLYIQIDSIIQKAV